MEPNVGDDVGDKEVKKCVSQLASKLASKLAVLDRSIFLCFITDIKQQGVKKYKCIDCGYIADRLDRALEHQRSKRDHTPFPCPKGW